MSSLIETTVGEVREACERAYAKYDDKVANILAEFNMKVAKWDALPWWKKLFVAGYPRWDWHLPEWWDEAKWRGLRNEVWRIQQSIKDVPNDRVMHVTVDDARLIKLGKVV